MQSVSVSTISYLVLLGVGGASACSNTPDEQIPFNPIGSSGNSATSGGNGRGSPGAGGTTGTVTTGGSPGIMVPTTPVGGGGPMIDSCADTASTAEPLPPQLEFLIDTSGSMNDVPGVMTGMRPPAGAMTKWVSTRNALTQAFTDMADGTRAGLIFYPNVANVAGPPLGGGGGAAGMGAMDCINRQVAVPLAPINAMQRMQILQALQRKTVSGRTPTHDAYKFAVETVAASTLSGSKYVVLVTDGSPTFSLGCTGDGLAAVDASPIVAEAANALASQGIKTFVIGSPGSEDTRASLSQMATAGGTAPPGCSDAGPTYCHFDMTQVTDLSAALNDAFQKITTQIVSCSYTIPAASGSNVIDPTKVNVKLTTGGAETPLVQDATPGCTDGWQYSADQKQIVLCSNTCNAVKADMTAKVNLIFGCTTMTR
jgi:hypothetical protein